MGVRDDLPHSRSCGMFCRGHGSACKPDCPTCGGRADWIPPALAPEAGVVFIRCETEHHGGRCLFTGPHADHVVKEEGTGRMLIDRNQAGTWTFLGQTDSSTTDG